MKVILFGIVLVLTTIEFIINCLFWCILKFIDYDLEFYPKYIWNHLTDFIDHYNAA